MEDDKIRGLYNQLKNDGYELDDEETFREGLKTDQSYRQLIYNTQKNDGYNMNGDFNEWEGRLMGYLKDDDDGKPVDLSAATARAQIGADIIPIQTKNSNTVQSVSNQQKPFTQQEYDNLSPVAQEVAKGVGVAPKFDTQGTAQKIKEQLGGTKERTQYVPESSNVVMATPTADTLKKYPFLKADEAVPFNRETGEPFYTWLDENGKPLSQRDIDIRTAKQEITGEREYMQKAPAAPELPDVNANAVKLDGSITDFVDNQMRAKYGDNYLNEQFKTSDGREVSGTDYLTELSQGLYDGLVNDVNDARIQYIDADDEQKNQIVTALADKYKGLVSRDTIESNMTDEKLQAEAKDARRRKERQQLDEAYNNAYSKRAAVMGENMAKAQEAFDKKTGLDKWFGGNAQQMAYWMNQNDNRIKIADTQINLVLDAKRVLDTGKAYDDGESWSGRLVRGMRDAMKDTGLYDGGIEEMNDLRNVKFALDAYESGNATAEQKDLLDTYTLLQTVNGENKDALGGMYGAGFSSPQTLTFMAQWAINPLGGLGQSAMKATTQYALKQFGRSMMSKYMKRLLATSFKAGGRITGDMLAASLPAMTFGAPAIGADMYDRLIGNVKGVTDNEGNIEYSSREGQEKSKAAAIAKAIGSNYLEYQSEMVGEYFRPLTNILSAGIGKATEKMGLGQINDLIANLSNKNFYRSFSDFAKRTQWQGTIGEYLEEVVNNAENALFIGDMDFSTGPNGVFNKDVNIDTFLAVAVMTGFMSSLKTADYIRTRGRIKNNLDNAYNNGLSLFGVDEWEKISNELDNIDENNAAKTVKKLVNSVDDKDMKQAIANYAAASAMNHGFNIGDLKNNIEEASDNIVNGKVPRSAIPGFDALSPDEQPNVHDDGMIHSAILYPIKENGGNAEQVFIVKGNVALNNDGSVDVKNSSDAIYYKGSDGQIHQVAPDKILAADVPVSVEDYLAAKNNEAGNVNQEPSRQAVQYSVGDEVNIDVNGQSMQGEVAGTTEDGNYIVSYENEDGTMSSVRMSPEELAGYNQETDASQQMPEVPTSTNVPQTTEQPVEAQQPAQAVEPEQPVESNTEQVQPANAEGTAQVQQEQPAQQAIPKDKNGRMIYDQAPVEATIQDLYNGELDDEEVQGFIDANIADAQKKYDNAQKKKPKIGTDKAKYLEQKKNWQADVDEAKRVLDYWQSVDNYRKEQTHTTDAAPQEEAQQTVAQKIADAEAQTDTNPTEAQKEAGNYKKGHVTIDGYNITIEQPKGSVRRGTDANGKKWEQTMNNTYGYIRGTEGVDGDHIDIFLSDNPTEGNVYVVGQVNPDGSFDEHKVMYGFNSADEARNAYLSNYEEGWQGLGTITEVSKDEFKKWVESSHRKTKPFAEYKSVNKDGAQNEGNTLANEAHELFSDIIAQSTHNVEINDSGISETDNTLYAPIKVDGKDTSLSLYQEEPAHSSEEPIVGVSYYREGLTYQEAADLSDEYNKYVGERVCADGSDELAVNFGSIDEAVRFEEWLNDNRGVRFREADNEISDFARKHNLNEKDVQDYADYMRQGNLNGASGAFHDIRRKIRIDNKGVSLGQFAKIFSPIRKELYEKFGNIDEMREQYVQHELEERSVMEAARKRAEEAAETERRRLQEFQDMSDEQLDDEYMKAVEANDENRMRDLVNEAARRNGYGDVDSEYQGVGAWSAPSNPGYESDEERRAAVENDAPDVNITDIANGYSQQPSDYFTNLRAYGTDTAHGRESAEAINKAIDEVRNGKDPMVKVYRAVPKSVKEGKLRNGDWVTPSRKYAEMHGDNRLEGDYRIIEQDVPASQLWWDGNDINEWGFDDGKGYAYRNTKNNRKLNDLITRDDNGNIIPLSQRFNARKSDVRYRNTENQAATDNIEDVNKQFNQQLEGLTEENADKVTLSLGSPSAVLRAAGVEDKPMKLYGNKVIKKMRKHGFTLAEIKDLPRAVADPIAVFNNYQKNGNRSILTELQIGDKHILVSVTVGKTGVDADFNIVSSVFSKGSNNVVDWINKGYATFINKEKALDYLHFSERSISEASDNQELVSTANIIRNFENPNVLEENLVPTEQTNDIDTAVADTANKLNVGVRVAHSVDEVSDEGVRRAIEQGRRIQGFYDTRTGEIVVYAPNVVDAEDAVRTVLHEGVAHYGLRQLVGEENFGTFLDNIYNNVSDELKQQIDAKAREHNWSARVATEEYLASLAEDTNFEQARNSGIWDKIKDFFMDLLTKAGIRLNNALSDNELRYILWRSYDNLQNPTRDVINTVRDITKQRDLNVGNYAVQNSSEKVADNDDIRYREAVDELPSQSRNKFRELYEEGIKGRIATLIRAYFDRMQPMKKLQEAIEKETSQPIQPEENVYLQENRAMSVANRKYEIWERSHMEPVREAVVKLMKDIRKGNFLSDVLKRTNTKRNAYNAVIRYMKSKHGLENNEYRRDEAAMAARKPFEDEIAAVQKSANDNKMTEADAEKKIKELREQADKAEAESRKKTKDKDYSGLQGIYGKDFEQKAKDYVGAFEERFNTDDFWEKWNGATKSILSEEYDAGLISKELYDKIRGMYKYYIPLKGWAENRAEDVYTYYTTGSGDGGKPQSRKGRTSESDDPLVTLEQDADRQFNAAARNNVKRSLYNLATTHKSDLLTVRRQWYQNMGTKENPDWQRVDAEIPENATPEEMEKIVSDFEKNMRELAKDGMAMRQKRPMILPYHATKRMEKEHTVRVMVNGKEYVIYVNGDPAAAQAVNGTSTPKDPDNKFLENFVLRPLRWFNRTRAALLTAWNYNFIPSNLSRDAQYSIQNMKAKEPATYVMRYVKNLGEGMAKFTSARLFYKDKNGTLDMNDPTERLFKEFLDNGGETGYSKTMTLEQRRRNNMSAINKLSGIDWTKGARLFFDTLAYANRSIETIVRFAAYKTSREAGRSIVQSINDAKEASVNFDKHGSGEYGNKEWRLLYIFANVKFQSMRRMLENATQHPVRFTLAQAERFALGFAVPMLAKFILDSFGDDDEKDAYEALPEWMRQSGLTIPISPIVPGVPKRTFLYLPFGPEDKVWYALGEMSYHEFNSDEPNEDMAKEFASLVADLLPVDVKGYGGNMVVNLAPTAVQDLVALEQNVNYWGQPIYRETMPYNENEPGQNLAFAGTPEWFVKRAEDINRLTGGNDYSKGAFSPKPEQIEYIINQTGGGVTRVISQIIALVERAGEDGNKDIPALKNTPVLSSFVKQAEVQDGEQGFDREAYYKYIDEYEKAIHDLKAYTKGMKKGDDEAGRLAEELKKSPAGERMDTIRNNIGKIRAIDKAIRKLNEIEKPTPKQEMQLEELKKESNEMKNELVDKLDDITEKRGE